MDAGSFAVVTPSMYGINNSQTSVLTPNAGLISGTGIALSFPFGGMSLVKCSVNFTLKLNGSLEGPMTCRWSNSEFTSPARVNVL